MLTPDAVANWLNPWYTILGFIAVCVGLGVYIRKGLKKLQGEQEETRALVQGAAVNASLAADAADAASGHAQAAGHESREAKENSRQANEAVVWLAQELAKANIKLAEATDEKQNLADVTEHLKERTDTLVGALARAEARRIATGTVRLPSPDTPTRDTGGSTVPAPVDTGKHRLDTSMIPTAETETDLDQH